MKSFYVLYRNDLDYCSNKEFSNWEYFAESKEEVIKNLEDLGFKVLQCDENH
jgi:hypothetical protein